MVKRHKRSLTLAALFLLLAQVFMMTFCNVTAIAVTKDENSKSLFDNKQGKATISYEDVGNDRLKWTVDLNKATQEMATRFMVEVSGDGQAVTPENVQTLSKSNQEMNFASRNGDGQITAGMYEKTATTNGSAKISFETGRSYTTMTVKPKLITDADPATDLLAGNTGVSFTLPVAVTPESESAEGEVATSETSETAASESSATEATSSTEVAATEETTATSEATESTEQSATTDSTEAEATEESVADILPAQSPEDSLPFDSGTSMLNLGDESDVFLYNGVLSGNHSPMQADTEGALFISGDSVVPEGGSFNYAGKFNHGGGTGGVGTDLTERHRIAVAIGGEIRNYSGSKPVVGGTKIPAGADEKSVKHPGYFLTKQSSATGWMTKLGTYPHIMEIQGPSRYLPDAEFGNMENDLRGQQRVYSMLDSKIAALNALDVKDREVYSKYTNWAGFNDNIIYRSPDDPSVLIYDLTKSSSGAVLLPGFRPEDSFIADDEVKQIIVYSDAEKVVAGHTDGVVDAKIAGKVIYYLPNATQVTNYAQKTGDYTATSVTAPDMPATFNNDAKNQFNETYFQDKEKKSAAYSGFLIAPKATAAMSGGNWNGYFWAHNLYQEGGWEIHNFYNPWVEEQVKFNFQLYKHDSTDKEKAIEDATFIFYRQKGDAIEYLQENNGTVEWTAIKEDAKEFVTDASGNISVTGIPEDTSYNYFFEEIDPALGYVLPENPVFQVGINETTKQPNVSIVSNTSIEKLTSLRVEKTWVGMENIPDKDKTIKLQLMRRLSGVEGAEYKDYRNPYEFTYDPSKVVDGVQVFEWNSLPVYETIDGKEVGPYEYTAREVESDNYVTEQDYENPTHSTINSLFTAQNCNVQKWPFSNPSFIVVRDGGSGWIIWTAAYMPESERAEFIQNIKTAGDDASLTNSPPFNQFKDIELTDNIKWVEGSVKLVPDESKPNVYVNITVKPTDTGDLNVLLEFENPSQWTQLLAGSHSMREVDIKNTYIPKEKITIEKKWDDNDNAYNTRKDIQLVLQRKLEGETKWSDVGTHNIPSGATSESELSKTFENLPSIINGKNAIYRVIEKVLNEDGTYTEGRVPGYETPKYSPKSISNKLISKFGTLTVTNKLLTTELEFTKVGNDESTPLSGVSFTVTGEENGYKKTLTTGDDDKVLFEDLLELNPDLIPELDSDNSEKDGYYTLTETGLPGYLSAGPWKFSVVYNETSNSMKIVWKDGKSPLKDDKLVNTLKPFDLTVNKIDDQKKALEGAEFTLTKEGDDSFKIVLPGEKGSPTSKFEFKNLAPGTYFLEETDAPDGYRGLTNPITIVIDELGKVTIDNVEQKDVLVEDGNNQITLTVENEPKAPLPSTGGPGTLFFSLIGMLALGATGLYFYFRKDQEVA